MLFLLTNLYTNPLNKCKAELALCISTYTMIHVESNHLRFQGPAAKDNGQFWRTCDVNVEMFNLAQPWHRLLICPYF